MKKLILHALAWLILFTPTVVFAEGLESATQEEETVTSRTITHDVLITKKPALISLGQEYGLAPNSETLICLGEEIWCAEVVKTDPNGQLFTQITLPEEVNDGAETLHVHATNQAGKSLNIAKQIDVNGPEIDAQIWPVE